MRSEIKHNQAGSFTSNTPTPLYYNIRAYILLPIPVSILIHVYLYPYLSTCTYTCIYTNTCLPVPIPVYLYKYLYLYLSTCPHTCLPVPIPVHIPVYLYPYLSTCTHTCLPVPIPVYLYPYLSTCTHTCLPVPIPVYLYPYLSTCTYTCIYNLTHILRCYKLHVHVLYTSHTDNLSLSSPGQSFSSISLMYNSQTAPLPNRPISLTCPDTRTTLGLTPISIYLAVVMTTSHLDI